MANRMKTLLLTVAGVAVVGGLLIVSLTIWRDISGQPPASGSQTATDDRILVTVPGSFPVDQRLFLGDELVDFDELDARVREVLEATGTTAVYVRSDDGVPVENVIAVVDRLKEGGAEQVGIVRAGPPGQ